MWELNVYKLKLFLKGIQEGFSIEPVQLLNSIGRFWASSSCGSIRNDQLEAKAEDDDTAEKEVEKD